MEAAEEVAARRAGTEEAAMGLEGTVVMVAAAVAVAAVEAWAVVVG